MGEERIKNISAETKEAIKRKSAFSLPDSPSARGWKAAEIKRAFYDPIVGEENSVLSELSRIVKGVNEMYEDIVNALGGLLLSMVTRKQNNTEHPQAFVVEPQSDEDALLPVSSSGKEDAIVRYADPDDCGDEAASKTFSVCDPKKPFHPVNKQWLEEHLENLDLPQQTSKIVATMSDDGRYVLTLHLENAAGEAIEGSETEIDLPLEMAFVGASLSEDGQSVIFALQNGETLSVGLSDIFKGKVNSSATTSGNEVYVREGGADKTRKLTSSGELYAIPWYVRPESVGGEGSDPSATFAVCDPSNPYHPANKKYVDAKLDVKLDMVSGSGRQLYACENSQQKMESYSASNYSGYIAKWGTKSSGTEDRGGCMHTSDPVNPYHCTNKRFVEGLFNPLREEVEFLQSIVGTMYDLETVFSTENPATVPSNALPAATIDKIGTGLKPMSVMQECTNYLGEYSPYVEILSENTAKINVADFTDDGVEVTVYVKGGDIPVEAPIQWRVLIVSGTYETEDGSTLNVADGVTLSDVNSFVSSTMAASADAISFAINPFTTFKCEDLILKFEVFREDISYEGVPVTSVQINGETVYTVPEAIRALKARADEGVEPQNAYGLALSDTLYNYLDLENKQYVINCAVGSHPHGGRWTVEHHEIIDVSAYLTDEDGEITVSAGDRISFCDNDGILVPYDVPNAITYYIKKGV